MERKPEIISRDIATFERKLAESGDNAVLKEALNKKLVKLKQELKGGQMSTRQLASNLLGARRKINELSGTEFRALILRLSKKPEYSFLKRYSNQKVRDDMERPAKPVGYRFKGRGNYDKPTPRQIRKGKADGTVYYEARPRRSDVNRVIQLGKGGEIDGFNLVYEVWSKMMGGDGVSGTIRTKPENYYVASIDEKGNITFKNLDSNTRDIDKEKVRKMWKNKQIPFKMKKGGRIDLFEDYENIPSKVQKILDKYAKKFGDDFGDMDYSDMADMHKEIVSVGYTFESGLDNMPYGLRPVGVNLNELEGFEDEEDDDKMAKGGGISSKTNYVPNRAIEELSYVLKGEIRKIKGSDIVDGVYVKKNAANTKKSTKETKGLYEKLVDISKKDFRGNIGFTPTTIKDMLNAGLSEEDIMIVFTGIDATDFIKADTDFGNKTPGLLSYTKEGQQDNIKFVLDNIKKNTFEIGLKYPNFNWKSIIKKYEIKSEPKIVTKKTSLGEYKYQVFIGKGVVIGQRIARKEGNDWVSEGNEITSLSKVNEYQKAGGNKPGFNAGYWGIVTRTQEAMLNIVKSLLSQPEGYVKDLDLFTNRLGGIGSEEVKNLQFATGGQIDNVFEWVGLDYSKEQIKEVFEAIEEAGYDFPRDLKTNASPFNHFEPAHDKVDEIMDSLRISALEGDNLNTEDIANITWGIVMSAHSQYGVGGDVKAFLAATKETLKKGYNKTKNYTKKQIHDGKKKVALDVLDNTKDKVKSHKDKMALKAAEEIIFKKYEDGGEIDTDLSYYRVFKNSNGKDIPVKIVPNPIMNKYDYYVNGQLRGTFKRYEEAENEVSRENFDLYADGGNIDSGLMVIGKTQTDNDKIGRLIEENDFYAEWNAREGFWFFPEELDNYDELENHLQELFDEEGVDARFEGVFEKGGSMYEKGGGIDEIIYLKSIDMYLKPSNMTFSPHKNFEIKNDIKTLDEVSDNKELVDSISIEDSKIISNKMFSHFFKKTKMEKGGNIPQELYSAKYALVSLGGSIGSKKSLPVFVNRKMGNIIGFSNDRQELKETANRMRKSLSPGERKYYGMSYTVIDLTPYKIKEVESLREKQN
jgi:hypothetical protein